MYQIGNLTVYGEHEEDPGGLSVKIVPYAHHAAYAWWSESTRDVLAAMDDLLIKGATVLDFGCGASAILALAAKAMGAKRVVACEISPEMAGIAMLQINANDTKIKVVPLDDEKYDVILANVGDEELVAELMKRSTHGIGTRQDGTLLKW